MYEKAIARCLFNHRNLLTLLNTIAFNEFLWPYHKFQIISRENFPLRRLFFPGRDFRAAFGTQDHHRLQERAKKQSLLIFLRLVLRLRDERNNNHFWLCVVCMCLPFFTHSVLQTWWVNKCIYLFTSSFLLGFINEVIIIFIYARSNKTVRRNQNLHQHRELVNDFFSFRRQACGNLDIFMHILKLFLSFRMLLRSSWVELKYLLATFQLPLWIYALSL